MNPNIQILAGHHRLIRDRLRAEEPEIDEQTLADTLEGLTDLHDVLRAVIRSALEEEALADGLKGRIAVMEGRLERLQARAQKRREIVRDVMVESALKKIVAPDFTVSLRLGMPSLIVIEERLIPRHYFEPREPRLNRQDLLSELKSGGIVAGVELSNPSPVLSVRTR